MFHTYNAIVLIVLALAAAALVAYLATPVVRMCAVKIGAIDVPKDNRRMHTDPVPRMGGLAIFLGFFLSVVLFAQMTDQIRSMLIGSVIIVILGVLDDKFTLKALPKLIVQIIAALVAVFGGNVISYISNPNIFSSTPYLNLGILSVPISVLWIVAITNAVNLIDGLDGLAVGVSTISSLTMLVIALMVSDSEVAIMMGALTGACLGFLPYNKNPASIFMGDTGSTFLGYILAVVSIQGLFKMYSIISFVVPFLILGLPIFDTGFAFIRRIAHGQNPMQADRSHVHHRLIDMGLSQKQTVAVLYIISAVLGVCAVLLSTSGALRALAFLAVVLFAAWAAFMVYHAVTRFKRTEPQEEPAKEEAMPQSDYPQAKNLSETADRPIRVMTIFGTRPEAIKMCPLLLEFQNCPEIQPICCVTAQHREMLDSVLEIFGITPDYDLNIMQPRQTLSMITSKCLNGIDGVLEECRPDLILVHGDTSTTFAGALAAFYHQVPVGHVEAGLRTWDRYSPYPEEMNRRMTSDIAELHFAPTAANRENLAREDVHENVFVTGNTVIDALKTTVRPDYHFTTEALNQLDFEHKKIICVTCHRRENYGEPMRQIMTALKRIAEDFEDVELVYPVHLSPVVREAVDQYLAGTPGVTLIDPLTADEMHNLMAKCYMVMTDSGGLQEEAPALGKPVLVLRKETERPEAVAAGTVKVAGVEEEEIYQLAKELIEDPAAYQKMAHAVNPYGDGNACRRITEAVLYHFGRRDQPPADFRPDVGTDA